MVGDFLYKMKGVGDEKIKDVVRVDYNLDYAVCENGRPESWRINESVRKKA